jgi:tetratricopeptide (TPR) repeat protein
MSRLLVSTLFGCAALCVPAGARAADPPSPAERHVARAESAIQRAPKSPEGYADLALALSRRARETSDPAFYARAVEATDKALALAPDDFGALKARAWALLGQHEFAAALELARALNARAPDDVMVYGLLTDAYAELGRYAEAEKACQWMLDLRPANVPAMTRAAYLRELFGDVEGALALMREALEQTPPSETEDRAWMLTQAGHLHQLAGRLDEAERALQQALADFPGYHYALGALARVRTAQGRHAEAVALLRQRQETAAHPENLYELAEALERAGARAQARRAFAAFEKAARAESSGADNANRELIFYYLDHGRRPAEALRIAEAEVARRRDVYTLDAYAWALASNGRLADARRAIDEALAVGVRDPRIRRHAEVIARRARRASR